MLYLMRCDAMLQIGHSCASVKLLLVIVAGQPEEMRDGQQQARPEKGVGDKFVHPRSFDPSCLRRPATTTTDGWMDGWMDGDGR